MTPIPTPTPWEFPFSTLPWSFGEWRRSCNVTATVSHSLLSDPSPPPPEILALSGEVWIIFYRCTYLMVIISSSSIKFINFGFWIRHHFVRTVTHMSVGVIRHCIARTHSYWNTSCFLSFTGEISLKIPWTNPYSEPYVISVQDVYLIASPIKGTVDLLYGQIIHRIFSFFSFFFTNTVKWNTKQKFVKMQLSCLKISFCLSNIKKERNSLNFAWITFKTILKNSEYCLWCCFQNPTFYDLLSFTHFDF